METCEDNEIDISLTIKSLRYKGLFWFVTLFPSFPPWTLGLGRGPCSIVLIVGHMTEELTTIPYRVL